LKPKWNEASVAVLAASLVLSGVAFVGCGPKVESPWGELAGVSQFVPNPSFEEMDGERPAGWRARGWGRRGAQFAVENEGRTGNRSVAISSTEGTDASWLAVVPIIPYSRYRLSGWIKTDHLEPGSGRGALVNIHGFREWTTPAVTGTRDWTRVEVEFDAGANDAVEVTCLFGGWGRATGKAWYDDVSLERLSGRNFGTPSVTIDAAATRPPLSELVYGQFIEHLGRCIYQGIWAEMFEDRKFFHPVGGKESPWEPVGSPSLANMDTFAPFVGEHSPRINLDGRRPGGIVQDSLALLEGKEYSGRAVLAGHPGAAPVRVSLIWGEGPESRQTVEIRDLSSGFKTFPLAFRAGGATDDAKLEISSAGRGWFKVGTVSLMPSDNVDGFRPDVLARLRELDSPIYRWPGGNFVSGYDWKDGIGDRDKRPPRKNPAWQGVEHNDVGLHEYLNLMELLESEPYITVNSGLGDVKMAIDEVRYVNGPADSPMGRRRVLNGRVDPWKVTYWSVGNEMYGSWQLGHMPLSEYVKKHIQFAVAMKAADPSIKIVAVGAVGDWSRTMLAEASHHMDFISEHFYCQERPGLLAHVNQVPAQIRRIAEAHRSYRGALPALRGLEIPIALDEWNYWYGPYLYGELGTQYFLQDALGIASGFHEFARQSDLFVMANYAQTVNVIGAIKTSKTEAVLDTTGLVLKLYRLHFGSIPVEVTGSPEPLDVMACWKEGREVLALSVVNPTRSAMTVRLKAKNLRLPKTAKLRLIAGDDPKACNVPGKPPGVVIEERDGVPFGKTITVPPISVSLYELVVK
jgi:alpha-N-arabinofuranosidase